MVKLVDALQGDCGVCVKGVLADEAYVASLCSGGAGRGAQWGERVVGGRVLIGERG